MNKNIYLLIGIIILYMAPALTLKVIYGDSYEMWQDENEWVPDGNNSWTKHGEPADPMPDQPSINMPLALNYIPIFLPTLLLVLFMFTPLSKLIETKIEPEDEEEFSDVDEDEDDEEYEIDKD